MTHVDPSLDASGDEPFDRWMEDIVFRHPGEHIDSHIGDLWTGFTVFFKNAPPI